jgi:hypothetical protein
MPDITRAGITREDIKKAVERFEYYDRGLYRMDSAYVEVTNLRLRKKRPITADVTIAEGNRRETYLNREYILNMLTP